VWKREEGKEKQKEQKGRRKKGGGESERELKLVREKKRRGFDRE